jgi:serine/threonine-protein kinase HipA
MTSPKTKLTKSAKPRLVALLNGLPVGTVFQMGNGRLVFRYEEKWRLSQGAYPLSLSMPLTAKEHGDRATRAYLWGLLPDNPDVLEWWARRYGVSRYRVVDILSRVGEDCAGAVQFIEPPRLADLSGPPTRADVNSIHWVSEADLANRLRDLRVNPAAGRAANDTGQFSLAGAQPKTALFQDGTGRWGVPQGRMPTNRILKLPTLGLDDLAYNEHFCLLLARELGFPAAESTVGVFGDEIAIVVNRYDREEIDGSLVRVHQEDMCQALGIMPTRKYEFERGPNAADIAELLRQASSSPEEDVIRFVETNAFNWLIGGTDAHAKNYSILHARGPQLRLAPLYDLISVLPYPQLTHGKSTLAMSVGGERLITAIRAEHWRLQARRVGLNWDRLIERIRQLAVQIPHAIEAIEGRSGIDDHTKQIVHRLGGQVADHARDCLSRL